VSSLQFVNDAGVVLARGDVVVIAPRQPDMRGQAGIPAVAIDIARRIEHTQDGCRLLEVRKDNMQHEQILNWLEEAAAKAKSIQEQEAIKPSLPAAIVKPGMAPKTT
jgi:hypothetical protein